MKKIIFISLILMLIIGVCIVVAVTNFTPKADIDMQNRYDIINGRNAEFSGNLTVNGTIFGVEEFYFDKTTLSYDGELTYVNGLVGYEAGNAICNAEFPGTHLCQEYEMINTMIDKESPYTNGWADFAWVSAGGAKYAPATIPFNDCNGWKNATAFYGGNFFDMNNNRSLASTCDSTRPLACCKGY